MFLDAAIALVKRNDFILPTLLVVAVFYWYQSFLLYIYYTLLHAMNTLSATFKEDIPMPELESPEGIIAENAIVISKGSEGAPKVAEYEYVFDETFGIIRKDIIDSWEGGKQNNESPPVSRPHSKLNLPPVRFKTE